MIWSQSRNGRAIDLINPSPEDVDFREIADTLAQINRFAGCSQRPVSVALHTLICLKAAEYEGLHHAMPWIALHDAPEARLGDMIRPAQAAIAQEIRRASASLSMLFSMTLADLHDRHFVVICDAAGLARYTGDGRTILQRDVKRIDNLALMAERASFLAPPSQPWDVELEIIADHPFVRRRQPWLAPDKAADALYERFTQLLPALRRNAA